MVHVFGETVNTTSFIARSGNKFANRWWLSNGAPFEAEINPKFCFFFKRRLHAMLHNVKRDVKRDMI